MVHENPTSETTVAGILRQQAAYAGESEALVFPDARATFLQLDSEVDRFCALLREIGVEPGENVAIMLPNDLDFAAAILATLRIGACAVPVNLRFKETELAFFIAHSEATLIITTGREDGGPAPGSLLPEVLPGLMDRRDGRLHLDAAPNLRHVVWLDDAPPPGAYTRESLNSVDVADRPALEESAGLDDVAMIMYTSGTTAKPKGAMITQRALTAQARAVGGECYRLRAGDRLWTPLPMFHTGGLMAMLGCIATGATYVHSGAFTPDAAIEQLQRERIAVAMPVFEPIWMPVLNHPEFQHADLSALRFVQIVGVPAAMRAMQARLPQATHVQASGMTEATSYFAFGRVDDPEDVRITTSGYPLPTFEVRTVDPVTGEDAGAGNPGETLLRGRGCFVGYYNDPETTAEVFDSEGWFHTGDVGVLDDEGRYTFVSRIKDMLKVGGENVAAAEVEDFLSQHPAVGLVQVVSAPDAHYVEVPAAYVQLSPGVQISESALEQELIDFCLNKIATFKIPRYVRIVSEWPMSGTKIQKYRLRERIADELRKVGVTEAPRITAR